MRHVVDLDAHIPVQEGRWHIESDVRQGTITFNPERLIPYLCEFQLAGWRGMHGRHLLKHLRGLPILKATALDYLMSHQELIPEWCKRFHLHFWGTIYRERKGGSFVRCLYWHDGWCESDTLVEGFGWTHTSAAALYIGVEPL